jgi:hypothetical protein
MYLVGVSLKLVRMGSVEQFLLEYIYIRLGVQPDVHGFKCIIYSSIFFALRVSGAICSHPQEHKLHCTTIGMCNGYGMLIHWSRYWLGHPHTFSMVKSEGEVSQPVPAPMD